MAVRSTMAALIATVRDMIYDPAGSSQMFPDQTIQDVLDRSRLDIFNLRLKPYPTFSGSTIQYLDYTTDLGGWEDGYVIKQYLTVVVTPNTLEPIAGHWGFAQTTLPPCYISGRLFDVYRASADLLERWAARWVLRYSMTVNGQSLQRGNVNVDLQKLALTYRMQQRPTNIILTRTDVGERGKLPANPLGPTEIDFMGSG